MKLEDSEIYEYIIGFFGGVFVGGVVRRFERFFEGSFFSSRWYLVIRGDFYSSVGVVWWFLGYSFYFEG